jgi:replication factor A1
VSDISAAERFEVRTSQLIVSVILSDGVYFIQSMLATQLNSYVDDKSLDKNVVIKLTQFVTNAVQGRK